MKSSKGISLVAALFALALTGGASAEDVTITTDGLTFSPADARINLGDTVTWVMLQPSHNVAEADTAIDTAYNGDGFYSGAIGAVDTFELTFESTGIFFYICENHVGSGMRGSVTVQGSLPQAAVTAPNGGEQWEAGKTYDITWTSAGVLGTGQIELLKGGVVVEEIATGFEIADGTYAWTIDESTPADTDYGIRITSHANAVATDESDADFRILPFGLQPSVQLLEPNGGETWVAGDNVEIVWTSGDVFGDMTAIFRRNGIWEELITDSTPAEDGGILWQVPLDAEPDDVYTVLIHPTVYEGELDESDADFEVIEASFGVRAPNGPGITWLGSQPHEIAWNAGEIEGTVEIMLMDGAAEAGLIDIVPATDESYSWDTIEPEGSNYRIRITSISDPAVTDESDAAFTIGAPTTGIVVTSPVAGDRWTVNSTEEITWTAPDLPGNVLVQLLDRRVPIRTIDIVPASDQSLVWDIDLSIEESIYYQIGIISSVDDQVSGLSEEFFELANDASVTVLSPNGGEVWVIGETYTITWTSENLDRDVTIAFRKAGVNQLVVTDDVPASEGTFDFEVPVTTEPGDDYSILIHAEGNPENFDISDADFSVVAAP